MQIRLNSPNYFQFLSFNSRQLFATCLSGTVIISTISVLTLNNIFSEKLNASISKTFEKIALTKFGKGLSEIAKTFKDWGIFILSSKDDFKEWIGNYFGPDGFKSGVVNLYEKLIDWTSIVYTWFKEKFLEFIANIPKMVENWRKLRLSLFKWGTFLGGGGGSALWGIFSSGDNWGKFSQLMGHPNFEEMMSDFNTLVENNPDAFEKLGTEGIEEIINEYLENPDKAKEDAKELIKDQEKKKQEADSKPEEEKKEAEQLTAEEISEKFSKQKGGKPSTPEEALWGFVGAGLKSLIGKKPYDNAFEFSKKAMEEHFEHLLNESKRAGKIAEVKKEFVENIREQKDQLIRAFAGLASRAFSSYNNLQEKKPEMLGKFFEEYFKDEFTTEGGKDTKDGVEIDGKIQIK